MNSVNQMNPVSLPLPRPPRGRRVVPTYLLILALALLAAACEPEAPAHDHPPGTISMRINGELTTHTDRGNRWLPAEGLSYTPGDPVAYYFSWFSDDRWESHGASFIARREVGMYPVVKREFVPGEAPNYMLTTAHFQYTTDYGHNTGNHYKPILGDEVADFIEITSVEGPRVRGRFQGSFARDLTRANAVEGAPDTVIVTEGTFEVYEDFNE